MKTIGIITFHDSINYGAQLQTYALQKILGDMGCKVEIIDYRSPNRGLASFSRLKKLRSYVWRIAKKILVGTKREQRTNKYREKYLPISKKRYTSFEELHLNPPIYDVYITGSDQVWNPTNNNGDSSYFLTFAPEGKRRISYAASFGRSILPEKFAEDYSEWLKQMDYISVREFEGQDIIKQLIGQNVEITLDPTLLLDKEEWSQIAEPTITSKRYILCYYMPGDKLVNKKITEVAQDISNLTGWDIVNIGQKEYVCLNPFKESVFDAGPTQFLGLFQNASFIVTNSFHGTAFSIIYRKPFYVPVNDNLPPEKALSSRISTLLTILQLEDRMISVEGKVSQNNVLELDYNVAEPILNRERQSSVNFLKRALGEGN